MTNPRHDRHSSEPRIWEEVSLLGGLAVVVWASVWVGQWLFRVPAAAQLRFRTVAIRGEHHRWRDRVVAAKTVTLPWRAAFRPRHQRSQKHASDFLALWRQYVAARRPSPWRTAAHFGAVAMLIATPIWVTALVVRLQLTRAEAMESLQHGVAAVREAGQALAVNNFQSASSSFVLAGEAFRAAEVTLQQVPASLRLIAAVTPSGYSSATRVLEAAEALAHAGEVTSLHFGFLQQGGVGGASFDMATLVAAAETITADVARAVEALQGVDPTELPNTYRERFAVLAKDVIPPARLVAEEAVLATAALKDLLGFESSRRYLVIFQNTNERRATGGFMGSFALIDVYKGRLSHLEMPGGGTYDMQGSLQKRVQAPEPLRLINARWEFQDANWWPDWPTSAEKIHWFYRWANGPSVDGVVAIDLHVVQELLRLTGPISVPGYDITVTADNFAEVTQEQVELNYDKEANRPKQFLADLAPVLIERLQQVLSEQGGEVAALLGQAVREKHVLVYRTDVAAETTLKRLGWAGDMATVPAGVDTLNIVHTNIAGQKTDAVVRDAVRHSVHIAADGSVLDTVYLTRKHGGRKGDLFTGVRNVDYVRFYVPAGSELVAAQGFATPEASLFDVPDATLGVDDDLARVSGSTTIDPANGMRVGNELGRTVFGHWIMVDPGQEVTVQVTYRLPWRIEMRASHPLEQWVRYFAQDDAVRPAYHFFWEQQPGSPPSELLHEASLARGVWQQGSDGIEATPDGWRWYGTPHTDLVLSSIFH